MTNFEKWKASLGINEVADIMSGINGCEICPVNEKCMFGDCCKLKFIEWAESEAEQ